MRIEEAERILDIVSGALQTRGDQYGHRPVSALGGHDLCAILTALKLRIANEFLLLARRPDFEKQFSEGLKFYDSVPWQIMRSFVADEEIGLVGANLILSPIDRTTKKFADSRLASMETGTSFGDYCKSVGANDPNYWQQIYIRIGLEYTSTSPRANIPVK